MLAVSSLFFSDNLDDLRNPSKRTRRGEALVMILGSFDCCSEGGSQSAG